MLSREEWRQNRTAFALCAASGLLGIPIFPGYSVHWLAWFALVPLLLALPRLRGKALAWGTMIFGFVWQYPTLFWLNTLVVFHPLIPAGVLFAAFVEAAYFLLFTFPASFVLRGRRPWLAAWAVALLWTSVEYLRSLTDLALPWNLLGHTQVGATIGGSIVQWAEFGGVFLVSAIVALGNAMNAALVRSIRERLFSRFCWKYAIFVVMLGLVVMGGSRLARTHSPERLAALADPKPSRLRIALIQPNISQIDKWNSYAPETSAERRMQLEVGMARKQFAMIDQAHNDARSTSNTTSWLDEETSRLAQLYLLPETAFTEPGFVYDEPLHRELQRMAQYYDADIFFGADNRRPMDEYREELRRGFLKPGRGPGVTTHSLPAFKVRANADGTTEPYEDTMAIFNSAWLMSPEGGLSESVYNKVQLVPFGETAPLVDMIPYFQEKIMMVGSFQKGLEFTVFETDGVKYGALICFESAFGSLARGLVRNGAQMIVVLTNDAWYDPGYAIERGGFWGLLFRLPVIRTFAAAGPRQHYVHSFFRATEMRVPLVRVANTGISAVIGPDGKAAVETGYGEEAIIQRNLQIPRAPGTLYAAFGDLFAIKCLVFSGIVMALQFVMHLRRKRRAE